MEKCLCCFLLVTATLTWISPTLASTTRRPTGWTGRPNNRTEDRPRFSERFTDLGLGLSTDDDDDDDDDIVCTLRAYDAEKEFDRISEWYDLVKTPIDERTAMAQLAAESCEDVESKDVMCTTYATSRMTKLRVPGLTAAECIAVTMYTTEFAGGFYRKFNEDSALGVWEPYRVYTSLLYSALKKLAEIEPVTVDATLFRGMRLRCKPPDAKRIFWKTFTSTTKSELMAYYFGNKTKLVFGGRATVIGARIRNLSLIPDEDEVLIPPFEVFSFLQADGQTFYFSSSESQELQGSENDGTGPTRLSILTVAGVIVLPALFTTTLF